MLHTDIPTEATVRQLAGVIEPYCVTIYLPTSALPSESELARIELENQLSTAVERLTMAGADRSRVTEFEDSIAALIDDRPFWFYQSETLALFARSGTVQTFRLPNRLPAAVEVSDRFYVKPLIASVSSTQTAFVLALSQNAVRLIEITAAAGAYPVEVPDLPTDAASAVGRESISGRSPQGRIQGSEGQKVRLRQYARAVDVAIRPILKGLEVPLILAAAEPMPGIFRAVNSYPHLTNEVIRGNPDEARDADLAAAARTILAARYTEQLQELKAHITAQVPQGRAVTDLSDIARAATFGAVDLLMVDIERVIPGTVDDTSGAITFADAGAVLDPDAPPHYGVVDEIVRRALSSGARVLGVTAADVPGGGEAAATTRFAA
ncbi:MAG: hypothetical protein R6W83_10170 [Cryobacterium sp.]